jgi:hypothetical protein
VAQMKILFQSYNNFHDSPEKKAYWEECKLLKKPWIVIEVGSAGRFRKANVRYDFMTADYDLSLEAVALIEQKMAQLWGNQLEKMTTKKSKLTFSHCGKTSGEFSYLDFSEAKKFAEWLEPILYNTNNHISIKESMRQDSETPKVYGVSTISELLNKKKLSPSEKEYALFSALCEISPEKWDKQILLENGLFGRASQLLKIDESKTLYSTIEEAAFLENVSITRYMKDKISQAIVEIVQDAFKEFKEKGMDELKDEQIEDFIQKYLKRER